VDDSELSADARAGNVVRDVARAAAVAAVAVRDRDAVAVMRALASLEREDRWIAMSS
jgi:hypothetical protein